MAGPECDAVAVGGVSQSDYLKANHHSLRGRGGGAAPSSIAGGRENGEMGGGGVSTLCFLMTCPSKRSPSIISQSAVVSLDKGQSSDHGVPSVWAPALSVH